MKRLNILLILLMLNSGFLLANNQVEKVINDIDSVITSLSNFKIIYDSVFLEKTQAVLRLSELNKYDKGRVQAFRLLSIYHQVNGNTELVTENISYALLFAKKLDNKKILADVYKTYGSIKYRHQKKDKALEYYIKASNLYLEANDSSLYVETLTNIGNSYYSEKIYDKAMLFYNKSIEVSRKNNYHIQLKSTLGNLAAIYFTQGDFTKSLELFTEVEGMKEGYYAESDFIIFKGISKCYKKLEQYNLAVDYLSKALNIADSLNNRFGISSTHLDFGEVYLLMEDNANAEFHFFKCRDIATEIKYYDLIYKSARYLSEIYKQQNKHELALQYFDIYKQYKDSVIDVAASIHFVKISDDWEHEKQMEQIEAEYKQRINKIIAIILILVILTVTIIWVYIRQARRIKSNENSKVELEENLKLKEQELANKQQSLSEKKELLRSIELKLKELSKQVAPERLSAVRELISDIKSSKSELIWTEFESRFSLINDEFIDKLKKRTDKLSPHEIKLCSFIRLDLSTNEIAELTMQNPESINMARFRIRKKLKLTNSDVKLSDYLQKL